MARGNLAALRSLVLDLPAHAILGRHAYHQHDGVPGGDAIVLLTAAAPGWPPGQVILVTVELPHDLRPPLDVLTYWANLWRAHLGHPTALTPTMDRVGDLLDSQLHHLAHDPRFPSLAKDLTHLVRQVENVLHAGDRPDISRVPCWDCGTRLVRVWADTPDHDHWRCATCGEVYDQGRYERAQHDQLASRGADRYVPLMDAVGATGRPEQTVRTWARDGLVDTRRGDSGRVEVWWPDVRDRHRVTPVRRRNTR